MNAIKYRVSLDMFDTLSQATIKAKKCDSACQIHITLTDHGKIYNISEGCYATFNAKKSDGTFIYNNCTIEGNTIVYDFGAAIDENGICQVSAREGIVECEVTLYTANSEQLTSPRFTLFIDGTVYNGEEIVSSPNFDAFKKSVEHKMDKFGEVTETDELIEVDLENLTEDYSSKPIRFRFGNYAYFESSAYGSGFKFAAGDNVVEVETGGQSGFKFNGTPLRNVGVYDNPEDDDVANVGYVKKRTKSLEWQTVDEHTVTSSEVGYIDQYYYSSFADNTYFDLTEVFISIQFPKELAESDTIYVYIGGVQVPCTTLSKGNTQFDFHAIKVGDKVWRSFCGVYTGNSSIWRLYKDDPTIQTPENLTITSCAFPEGTIIKIYGKGVLKI